MTASPRRPCAIPGCTGDRLAGAMGWPDMLCAVHAGEIRTWEEYRRATELGARCIIRAAAKPAGG